MRMGDSNCNQPVKPSAPRILREKHDWDPSTYPEPKQLPNNNVVTTPQQQQYTISSEPLRQFIVADGVFDGLTHLRSKQRQQCPVTRVGKQLATIELGSVG